MIIEMLGRPKEHLIETLNEHVNKIGEIKEVKIISKNISEPKKDDKEDVFMCFSEVEISCPSLEILSQIVINFMPSSIEVVEPSEIKIKCKESTDILNSLIAKLHSYDAIARAAHERIFLLNNQLKEAIKIMENNNLIKDGKLIDKAKKSKNK